MLLNIYTLFDMKSGIHAAPFFMHNHATAIRAVQQLATDNSTMVGRHPADFILFCIGQYDDQLGQVLPAPQVHLGVVAEMIVREPQPNLFAGPPAGQLIGEAMERQARDKFANGRS